MPAQKLYTIGYEKADLEDFVATLAICEIEILVDVRERPISRRRGYSKKALARLVEEAGIRYLHLVGLGDPKEGRDAARSGQFERFRDIFQRHMETGPAREDLATAVEAARGSRVCLLCYERDPKTCHRAIVASKMKMHGEFELVHLGVREGLAQKEASDGKNGSSVRGRS